MVGVAKMTKESTMDLEQYSIEELQDFIQTEEYDQLDELSKKTLGDYINKATLKVADHAQRSGKHSNSKDFEKAFDRIQGIKKATSKLTKESYESLGLLVQAIQEGNASNMSQLFDKVMLEKIADLVEQRKQEIAEDLFSEEQIDELSKDTLNKYVNKATRDMRAADYSSGAHSTKSTISAMSGDIKSSDMHAKESNRKSNLADKRYSGILKAHRKLSK